jgi:hypothetical protein
MKLNLAILLVLMSFGTLAASDLHCKSKDGKVVSVMKDLESFYLECADQMYVDGAVCFTGSRTQTIYLIEELNEYDFYGGEAYFTDVHYQGKSKISYELYDGPNEMVMYHMSMSRCEREFFKN